MADTPTDDNGNTPVDMDDLDTFEKDFFQLEDAPEVKEEVEENGEDHPATDDDKDAADPEIEAEDEDEAEAEEETPKEKPKSKAQKRIEELVTEARVAQRERDAEKREREMLEKRLAEVEARNEVKTDKKVENVRDVLPTEAPNPDAVGEDGEPIYKLGEFDPKFIVDLVKFTNEAERKAAKEEADKAAKAEEYRKTQDALAADWTEKLTEFEKTHEDARESIAGMVGTFNDVDPAYGEYIATTILSSPVAPEIMYHLSQNIGEAQKIVASGPSAATFAIARLEAKFLREEAKEEVVEEKRDTKKVSDAPKPPETRTRGQGGRFSVPADTDDLDAFEREFFKPKKAPF